MVPDAFSFAGCLDRVRGKGRERVCGAFSFAGCLDRKRGRERICGAFSFVGCLDRERERVCGAFSSCAPSLNDFFGLSTT